MAWGIGGGVDVSGTGLAVVSWLVLERRAFSLYLETCFFRAPLDGDVGLLGLAG